MPQTTYNTAPAAAFAGLCGDLIDAYKIHKTNGETVAIPFGIAVTRGATDNKALLPATASDEIVGVVESSFYADNRALTGANGVDAALQMSVILFGTVWVKVEEAVTAGDPAFVRFAANGGNTQKGSFRKSVDSNTARQVKGAKYLTSALSGAYALLLLGPTLGSEAEGIDQVCLYPQASTASDVALKLFATPADRFFVITGASYENPTGLAQDPTNYVNVKVLNGTNIALSWSTLTGQQGTIGADSPVALALGTLANRLVPPGTVISMATTKGGTCTLPAGLLALRGYWI